MSLEPDDLRLAGQIANELSACRKRGIEKLDIQTHNQKPVSAPELTVLAARYVLGKRLNLTARRAQIKQLILDALDALESENQADSQLIRDLFFGDEIRIVTKSAAELLEVAQNKYDGRKEGFLARRNAAFHNFASFLITFASEFANLPDRTGVLSGDAASAQYADVAAPADDSEPDLWRYEVTSGYVGDGARFVRLLAEATNVTIVGLTNENLFAILRKALQEKRARLRRPTAIWHSLRIVFLRDGLLEYINDEHSESPDHQEALRRRAQEAEFGRRSVKVFLRQNQAARRSMYISPHLPPLTGTMFEMPNGSRIVQLLIRDPQHSSREHLFIELPDTTGYFSAVFEDVVHSSVDWNDVVPLGVPRADRFFCTGRGFTENVVKDGSGANGWVPAVLAVTWRTRNGSPEPLLQLRTEENAARELNRFSHLSGYILQEDYGDPAAAREVARPSPQHALAPVEFDLLHEGPTNAARRRVQMETGETSPVEFRPLSVHTYLHPDKEHLFFFVYACRLHDDFLAHRHAEMYHVRIPELLALRENQVFLKAEQLCQAVPMPAPIRSSAWEIVGLNLLLHGHADLGRRLMETTGQPGAREANEIRRLAQQTRQTRFIGERELQLMGLSGLQYREFFTLLLPLYAEIGVADAASQLQVINGDESKRAASAQLARLYQDEDLMRAIPVEL